MLKAFNAYTKQPMINKLFYQNFTRILRFIHYIDNIYHIQLFFSFSHYSSLHLVFSSQLFLIIFSRHSQHLTYFHLLTDQFKSRKESQKRKREKMEKKEKKGRKKRERERSISVYPKRVASLYIFVLLFSKVLCHTYMSPFTITLYSASLIKL